jgi:hypothetical protein
MRRGCGQQRGEKVSASLGENGDDDFSGTHLLDRRDKTRALNRMWWGGGCGDGRGLGAIPAPELFLGQIYSVPAPAASNLFRPLRGLQYLARYFTGEEAGGDAAGR